MFKVANTVLTRRSAIQLRGEMNKAELAIALLLALAASLSGCALGLSVGQRWVKAGATPAELQASLAHCTAEMRARPPVYDPSIRLVTFVPLHSLVDMSADVAARNEFSRACMRADGWQIR